jgi:hypothetical protein
LMKCDHEISIGQIDFLTNRLFMIIHRSKSNT